LRGGIPNKIVLFAWNQTFCPTKFWDGYTTVVATVWHASVFILSQCLTVVLRYEGFVIMRGGAGEPRPT